MNTLKKLFEQKKKNILSVFFTAGFPELNDTNTILKTLNDCGADLVEIGIPFSDPLADGPVIQASSEQALKNGMNLPLLFKQLNEIKDNISIPVVLMGYLNPVLQFGVEKFCREAQACGVSGVILPDLPPEIYLKEYKDIFKKYKLENIFLVTQFTEEHRIRMIDEHSEAFIYLVASTGTTGNSGSTKEERRHYFERIGQMKLRNPVLAGFGINNKESFTETCAHTNGAIIGTAFIKAIADKKNKEEATKKFIQSILN